MEMTQMNIRIPLELKKRGDEVLKQYGKSASEVMRNVWTYMVDQRKLPDCAEGPERIPEDIQKRLDLVEKGSHMLADFYAEQGLTKEEHDTATWDKMREELYEEEMLREYEAINA